jgi:integrase
MRRKITKRAVDEALPTAAKYMVRDTELKGFVLIVYPNGVKSYALDYRAGWGRGAPKRRYTIGRHGSPWTPEAARKHAKKLLGRIEDGGDPATQREADRKILTFSELIDTYLAEGCSHKKPTTLAADRGRIEHHLRPLLGKLKIDRLSRADIERMRDAVTAGKTAETPEKRGPGSIARGGKGAAAQCVLLVGSLMKFAVDRGLRVDNPAHGVKKAGVRKMERFLSETEIARLAEALETDAAASGNPYPAAAIRLLMLTGCRRSEIIGLRWQDVDFERQCLRLPDSKTGQKIVYLNAPATLALNELPRVSGNPHVIVGARVGAPLRGIDKTWFRVRGAAGLDNVRLHDLRHSFASVGAAGGLSLPIIGALLGHKHATTTARYAHLSADPLRAANDAVGARIAAAMSRRVEADAIADSVALPPRRGDAA